MNLYISFLLHSASIMMLKLKLTQCVRVCVYVIVFVKMVVEGYGGCGDRSQQRFRIRADTAACEAWADHRIDISGWESRKSGGGIFEERRSGRCIPHSRCAERWICTRPRAMAQTNLRRPRHPGQHSLNQPSQLSQAPTILLSLILQVSVEKQLSQVDPWKWSGCQPEPTTCA